MGGTFSSGERDQLFTVRISLPVFEEKTETEKSDDSNESQE